MYRTSLDLEMGVRPVDGANEGPGPAPAEVPGQSPFQRIGALIGRTLDKMGRATSPESGAIAAMGDSIRAAGAMSLTELVIAEPVVEAETPLDRSEQPTVEMPVIEHEMLAAADQAEAAKTIQKRPIGPFRRPKPASIDMFFGGKGSFPHRTWGILQELEYKEERDNARRRSITH